MIAVDLPDAQEGNYDDSNALVLPSKKRKTKKLEKEAVVKPLTKKERKRLEKIVAVKKKKAQVKKHFVEPAAQYAARL
nr:hypothetical protein BaRGS_011333 [Batillaria attramentaria]